MPKKTAPKKAPPFAPGNPMRKGTGPRDGTGPRGKAGKC